MLTVEQLIGDLLIQNNCVIVPAFGGFVAQRIAARVDEHKGTIVPPRKSVMFNKQLINNDGLLIAAFSQGNGIPYAEAADQLKEYIAQWNTALQQGERITIDRVGILYFDQERNLCFEQDRFYNLLLESFGLSSVHFVSTSDVQAVESRDQVKNMVKAIELEEAKPISVKKEADSVLEWNNEPVIPVLEVVREESSTIASTEMMPVHSGKSRAWRYIAAACLLPVAFYSFWIPVKTDVLESGIISIHDFNPFYTQKEALYKPAAKKYAFERPVVKKQLEALPEGVKTFSYEMDEDTYIPVSLTKKTPEKAVSESPAKEEVKPVVATVVKPTAQTSALNTSGAQIIVGSYSNRTNAQELVDLLAQNKISAVILERDGKIRVSVGSASQLKNLQPTLKNLGIAPWVLK